MLPEDQRKAYEDFYNSARQNKILDPKTTLMIHLATAIAVSCYPWMESYLGVARSEGITDEEIGAIQSVVMAVSAGKISAQLDEVRSRTKTKLSAVSPSPNTWGSAEPAWRALQTINTHLVCLYILSVAVGGDNPND